MLENHENERRENNEENNKNNYCKNIFYWFCRFVWRLIIAIITNPIFQLIVAILILNYMGMNLFKHTKVGIFYNYTENIVHDNRCSYHKNIK